MSEFVPTRRGIAQRGKRLEYFTIVWNSLEGLVGVIAGLVAGSEMLGNLLDNACKWAHTSIKLTCLNGRRTDRDCG